MKDLITLNYACIIIVLSKDLIHLLIVERQNGEKRFPAGVVSFKDIKLSFDKKEENVFFEEIIKFINLKEKEFIFFKKEIKSVKEENIFLNQKLKEIFLFLKHKRIDLTSIIEKSRINTIKRTLLEEANLEVDSAVLVEKYHRGPHTRYLYLCYYDKNILEFKPLPGGEIKKAYLIEFEESLVFLSKKHHEYYGDISQWLSDKI